MSNIELIAYIYGAKIGTLINHKNTIYFEYDKEFVKSNIQISPIKLNTNIIKTNLYTNQDLPMIYGGLAGVFFDSLPDRHGMAFIDKHFKSRGLKQNQITLLHKLMFIGNRGMGAIEYVPQEHNNYDITDKICNVKQAYEDMKSIIDNDTNNISIEYLMSIIDSVSPIGGGRPKMLIQYNSTTNTIKFNNKYLSSGFCRAIIKFDEIYYDRSMNFTKMEYVYMQMAKDSGIDVAHTKLYYEDDRCHLIVDRFDRDMSDNKIHISTASAMMHIDISVAQVASYEELLAMTLKITNNQQDIEEMYKRMVFNALSYNFDDHFKNFSYMMDSSGRWYLAPAYDITYSKGLAKEHITTLNNKGKDFILDDFLAVAKRYSIKQSKAKEIISTICDVLSTFSDRAKAINIDNESIQECQNDLRYQISLVSI